MRELLLRSVIPDDVLEIPVSFIDRYLTNASGLQLKVYLFLLRASKADSARFSVSDMAQLFDETPNKIVLALGYWASNHLLSLEYDGEELTGITLLPESAVAVSSSSEKAAAKTAGASSKKTSSEKSAAKAEKCVSERVQEEKHVPDVSSDPAFQELVSLCQYYMSGRVSARMKAALSEAYLLFDQDYELTEYLAEFCIDKGKLNASYLSEVASSWKNAGYKAVSDVKAALGKTSREIRSVMRSLGLKNREASPAEETIIREWLASFDLSLVSEACSRTLAVIHQPDFKYVSGILNRWKSNGIRTLSDVEKLDAKHAERKSNSKQSSAAIRTSFRNFEERNTDYEAIFSSGSGT